MCILDTKPIQGGPSTHSASPAKRSRLPGIGRLRLLAPAAYGRPTISHQPWVSVSEPGQRYITVGNVDQKLILAVYSHISVEPSPGCFVCSTCELSD